MTEAQVREIESGIYVDLTPIQKAARNMADRLPVHGRTLNDEAWRFFHFETNDFYSVCRTVRLACRLHGWPEPELISMEEFVRAVFPQGFPKGMTDQQQIMNQVGALLSEASGPVFVYSSYLEIRNVSALSESDHSMSRLSANLPIFRIMEAFARYCATERIIQRGRQRLARVEEEPAELFSNRLFFVSYGDTCILPDNMRDALHTVSYDSLEAEDCRCLLWEFHLRKERAEIAQLQSEVGFAREIAPLQLDDGLLEWYKNRMSGLEERQVRRLLASMDSAFVSGHADYTDQKTIESVIVAYKNGILKQHGRLEVQEVDAGPEKTVTGLDTLQEWLIQHADALTDYRAATTGILLVGIPGTGKSAMAKEVARQFRLPLVQMDMSRILGGHVGDSEKGMREMLNDLRFVAPCVLWIDEIEKSMSGAQNDSGDGGVIKRLFGMLLTFIQENKKPVFTVTTANNIQSLPPEFFRNGRFDGTFCLMMPDYNGCREIMQLKLNGYGKLLEWQHAFTLQEAETVLNRCVGTPAAPRFLTGADIEAHVKELYRTCERDGLQGRFPGMDAIRKAMDRVAGEVRTQALPDAPDTMEDIAGRYLYMMKKGLTNAGARSDTYAQGSLGLDRVRYYSFEEGREMPLCLAEPATFRPYRRANALLPEQMEPRQWYDARFFYELEAAMRKLVIFDKETPPETRQEYTKYRRWLAKKEAGKA